MVLNSFTPTGTGFNIPHMAYVLVGAKKIGILSQPQNIGTRKNSVAAVWLGLAWTSWPVGGAVEIGWLSGPAARKYPQQTGRPRCN
jgi:hypothetical protein